MSFGKRRPDVRAEPAPAIRQLPGQTASERAEAFRDHLLKLLKDAIRVADAIRAESAVPMPAIADKPAPEKGPLSLEGLGEHFAYVEDGRIWHMTLAYDSPEPDATPDGSAQLHLHELAGRILELNLFCQQANIDEALGVALQSPHIPDKIDAILARTAFFAGHLDNVVNSLGGDDQPRTEPAGDPATNLDRHLLMAQDGMLEPTLLERCLPASRRSGPVLLQPVKPHAGDYFLNGVYFPAHAANAIIAAEDAETAASAPPQELVEALTSRRAVAGLG